MDELSLQEPAELIEAELDLVAGGTSVFMHLSLNGIGNGVGGILSGNGNGNGNGNIGFFNGNFDGNTLVVDVSLAL